ALGGRVGVLRGRLRGCVAAGRRTAGGGEPGPGRLPLRGQGGALAGRGVLVDGPLPRRDVALPGRAAGRLTTGARPRAGPGPGAVRGEVPGVLPAGTAGGFGADRTVEVDRRGACAPAHRLLPPAGRDRGPAGLRTGGDRVLRAARRRLHGVRGPRAVPTALRPGSHGGGLRRPDGRPDGRPLPDRRRRPGGRPGLSRPGRSDGRNRSL